MEESKPPLTVIVVHAKERRAKCTVLPLRGHPSLVFVRHPRIATQLDGYVQLGLDGPCLSAEDAGRGMLILDGTWRRVAEMASAYACVPVRSLPPLVTAYPRISKVFDDPQQGLATVEALYAVHRLLGRPCDGLLDHYLWGEEFVAKNARFWG